jgi:hypothetical protein
MAHHPPPPTRTRPRTEASERRYRTLDLTFTMGKKSREKRAKQQERDRKREGKEEGPASSPGASTSTSRVTVPAEQEVQPPDHHDTPAAAATPSSSDDTEDEPASTTVSASDSTAAVAEKLCAFSHSCLQRLHDDIDTWVVGEFSGDIDAVKAAAERGDAKAQYALWLLTREGRIPGDGDRWMDKAAVKDYPITILAAGVRTVDALVRGECLQGQEEVTCNETKYVLMESAVKHHSAEAQYILGMLYCWQHGCARSKPDMLKTAWWFRMAAHQGLAEAQWELGEWFRRGVFCDVHMPFARKYIRRASKQGHAAALDRMTELRRCTYCGADGAPRKCKLCLEARYCDAACSKKHWRKGGGCLGGYDVPHKTACPRTHADDGASSDSSDDDGE